MFWLKEFFIVGTGLLMLLTSLGTSPELLGFLLNGYIENSAKFFVCIISSLGFVAIALAIGQVSNLKNDLNKQGKSLEEKIPNNETRLSKDFSDKRSIPFNEPGFVKNRAKTKNSISGNKTSD